MARKEDYTAAACKSLGICNSSQSREVAGQLSNAVISVVLSHSFRAANAALIRLEQSGHKGQW